jgi:hypothetical protein
MIIHLNTKSKRKKKKPDAKARALRASWEEILKKYEVKETKKPSKTRTLDVHVIRDGSSTSHISSVDSGYGLAPKKESPKYTGDEMIGIGQLHKSNAIPIFKQKDAEDLAKMRR